MKVNFSQTFLDLISKKPIEEEGTQLTLGLIGCRALMNVNQDTMKEAGEQKVKDHQLAARIVDGGQVEISIEEAARLKQRINLFFGPIIVGAALPMLEDAAKPQS